MSVEKLCRDGGECGSDDQVRGIETLTTYDSSTQEFIIDTPCESAQKYWIGGAAKVSFMTLNFSQASKVWTLDVPKINNILFMFKLICSCNWVCSCKF